MSILHKIDGEGGIALERLNPTETAPARDLTLISLLTLFAFLVHGYHPYAEDGGLYVAGIKHLLNPSLYPIYTPFVTAHLRFSLFAPLVAALTHLVPARLTRLPLPWILLTLYIASIWLTLYAALRLATRITPSRTGRIGAVTLLACWLTLPIAGTALILADPYLTARSLSTPLAILALTAALDLPPNRPRKALHCAAYLLGATLLHPLMAAYALITILFLLTLSEPHPSQSERDGWGKPRSLLAITFLTLLVAFALQVLAPAESPDYLRVVLTRYYWFPFWWHWYEQLGLISPPILLAILIRYTPGTEVRRTLARTAIVLTVEVILVAALFCRVRLATHFVASLQPLRVMQLVYIILIVILGTWLGERILNTHPLRWTLTFTALAAIMFSVQRQTFPASPHLELPTTSPQSPWVEAFLWARQNTPASAVFALDAHYITAPGEDAQHFRAIAERSALPDYSKDGGETSITPALTSSWTTASRATLNLDAQSDAMRLTTLKPLHATWLVLLAQTPTALPCPYINPTLKLCRLP